MTLILLNLTALFFRVVHSKIYKTKFERGEIQTQGCLVRSVNATSVVMNPHYLSSISANQNHLDVQTIVSVWSIRHGLSHFFQDSLVSKLGLCESRFQSSTCNLVPKLSEGLAFNWTQIGFFIFQFFDQTFFTNFDTFWKKGGKSFSKFQLRSMLRGFGRRGGWGF